MIRAACLALALAGPATAERLVGQVLCTAAWSKVGESLGALGQVTVASVRQDGDWCVAEAPVLDIDGEYRPDWHMDRLRFRGSALVWIAEGSSLPEGLELAVESLRPVVQTGDVRMDWVFSAQARPNGIDADLSLSWDPSGKVLRLESLSVDFPGDNLIAASARVTGVDLTSTGTIQLSATSFALTEADIRITMHGLFEWYLLMALAPIVLPPDGDMDAAAEAMRADLLAMVGDLPDASFSQGSKAALGELIAAVPNPAGDLTFSLRAKPGLGPVRLGGYAVGGMPETLADAAPLLQGVTVDIGWDPDDAP